MNGGMVNSGVVRPHRLGAHADNCGAVCARAVHQEVVLLVFEHARTAKTVRWEGASPYSCSLVKHA